MKKSTLIIALIALGIIVILGICFSASGEKGPKGTYTCTEEFFEYNIRFDGKTAYVDKTAGKVDITGENVVIRYKDGSADRYIYNADGDYLTDPSGTLKWEKKK